MFCAVCRFRPLLAPHDLVLALTLTKGVVFCVSVFPHNLFLCQGVDQRRRRCPGVASDVGQRWRRDRGVLLGVLRASVLCVLGWCQNCTVCGFAVAFAVLWRGGAFLPCGAKLAQHRGVVGTHGYRRGPVRSRRAPACLVIALFNAAPLAVHVERSSCSMSKACLARNAGWEGPLLLLFFLSAAVRGPRLGKLAERFGHQAPSCFLR